MARSCSRPSAVSNVTAMRVQGGGAGPKLIDPPAYPAFIVQLRTPRNVMPPFTAKVLTDQQAADIYAYISTFPKGPDARNIPLLQN